MANTYYDSELTAEEIEEVLEAINGIIIPANNGKVLAINNGKIVARSVQWPGGGGTLIEKSITQNGTYNASSDNADGYSKVIVNVPSGGGGSLPAEYQQVEYLQNDNSGLAWVNFPVTLNTGDILTYSLAKDSWPSGQQTCVGLKTSFSQATGDRAAFGLTDNKKRLFGGNSAFVCATEDPTKAAGDFVVTYGDTITSGKFTQSITLLRSPDYSSKPIYSLYYGRYSNEAGAGNAKFYPAMMSRADGTIYLHIVPCRRISDNKCGFFDLITHIFVFSLYGTFTAGPDVN